MTKQRVLVAMSGGVDSAGAAVLLQEQGYEAAGAYLHMHDYGAAEQDADDARRVCRQLGIPFFLLDVRETKNLIVLFLKGSQTLTLSKEGFREGTWTECMDYLKARTAKKKRV